MVKDYLSGKIQTFSSFIGLDLPYFITGGFWLTAATILSSIGGIFLSALFARLWPPDIYGQYSFLMSALAFISITSLPAMGQMIIQAIAEGKEGVFAQATKTVFRWSLLGSLILVLGSIYFVVRQNPNLAVSVFLSSLAFPFASAGSLFSAFYNGKKQFNKMALFGIFSQLSSIIATAFALIFFSNIIIVVLFSSWSTAIVNSLISLSIFKEAKNKREDKKIIRIGKKLSISQIFTIGADQADRFLIPYLLGFSANAVFSFATIIPIQIHHFLKILFSIGQPKIGELGETSIKKNLFNKALLFEILVVFVVLGYILVCPSLFDFLYPAYKDSAVKLSQIYTLSLLYFPGNLLSFGLLKKRGASDLQKINISYAFTTIICLLILIPTFGIIGAVVAKIIARLLQLFLQVYYFRKAYLKN